MRIMRQLLIVINGSIKLITPGKIINPEAGVIFLTGILQFINNQKLQIFL
jgi:hypothetical protein